MFDVVPDSLYLSELLLGLVIVPFFYKANGQIVRIGDIVKRDAQTIAALADELDVGLGDLGSLDAGTDACQLSILALDAGALGDLGDGSDGVVEGMEADVEGGFGVHLVGGTATQHKNSQKYFFRHINPNAAHIVVI